MITSKILAHTLFPSSPTIFHSIKITKTKQEKKVTKLKTQ